MIVHSRVKHLHAPGRVPPTIRCMCCSTTGPAERRLRLVHPHTAEGAAGPHGLDRRRGRRVRDELKSTPRVVFSPRRAHEARHVRIVTPSRSATVDGPRAALAVVDLRASPRSRRAGPEREPPARCRDHSPGERWWGPSRSPQHQPSRSVHCRRSKCTGRSKRSGGRSPPPREPRSSSQRDPSRDLHHGLATTHGTPHSRSSKPETAVDVTEAREHPATVPTRPAARGGSK
jgi:hypothetical protein